MEKARIAISLGDPAGVGPETIVGAWGNSRFHSECQAVVVGRPEILRRAARLLHAPLRVVEVTAADSLQSAPDTLPCLRCGSAEAEQVRPATIDPRGGQAAYDALAMAAELALDGQVDAITTAPLHKAALAAAGFDYPGHTELLADLCGARDVRMLLYLDRPAGVPASAPAPQPEQDLPEQDRGTSREGALVRGRVGLAVVHVTLHMALRDVFRHLTEERIESSVELADRFVRTLLADQNCSQPPRIGVAALNPHAGELGLFGDEELRIIAPAVARSQRADRQVEGPLPADTLLGRAADGEFDAVVAMYHDQGHIALKLLGMHHAVNVTLGLPIIRTSVAHGTAFDRAWQGRACTSGMLEALRVAARLVRQRARFLTAQPAPGQHSLAGHGGSPPLP